MLLVQLYMPQNRHKLPKALRGSTIVCRPRLFCQDWMNRITLVLWTLEQKDQRGYDLGHLLLLSTQTGPVAAFRTSKGRQVPFVNHVKHLGVIYKLLGDYI